MIFNNKHLHLLIIIFTVTIVSSLSSSSSSSSSSNFSLYGTTHMNQTTITLTKSLTNCTTSNSITSLINAGRIFYKFPIPFPLHSISNSNSTISFSTHFSFTIIPPPSNCLSGQGIAFLITSSLPHSLGSIGLPKNVGPNFFDSSFLAVEFDTSFDKDLDDINANHVGIDLDSVSSIASVDLITNGIDLKSGNMINSWIEYKGLEKVIEVWVGYDEIKPDSPILVAPIDFTKRFNGFMYVGFSAANGKGSSVHVIHNWQFKTFGSEDCLICFPAQPETKNGTRTGFENNHHHDRHKNKSSLSLALGLLLLNLILILVILGGAVLYMCLKKSQRSGQTQPKQTRICTFQEKDTNKIPKRLKLSEIRSVTKGFHRNQMIGEGQLSNVYKTDKNLAVKRFKTGSIGSQFATEFVTMVGSLQHKNLMKLQGWCCEQNELILVYDYMPNGSLEKILHHPTTNVENLSFEIRSHILVGVSLALLYLHEECGRPIIHRNVKSCNIMLDFDFTPKLGDFGVAELHDHNSKSRDITVPARCMGYLAPEYVYSGVPTVKTDVYSFGVVMLEVTTGRPAVDKNGVVVTDWVWDLWDDKRLVDAADCKLMGRFNRVEMEMMLMVGLVCVHPNYEKRPTMKVVMKMLKGEVAPELPVVKPTVMVQSVTSERSPEVVVRCGGGGDECDGLTSWGTPKSHFSKG